MRFTLAALVYRCILAIASKEREREKGTAMRTISWRLVIEVTAMVAMMLFASYVEGTVPVWAR